MNIKSESRIKSLPDRQATLVFLLFGAAVVLAITVRLIGLGNLPLSDKEASLGLQATKVFTGESQLPTAQALYQNFTGVFFWLFGAGNFTARLLPAIFGSLLAFTPYLFRKRISATTAIILAYLIALDPCLLGFSRQADSTILAITLLVFCIGFFLNGHTLVSGICAGLALMSGPQIWFGLIGVCVAMLWFWVSKTLGAQIKRDRPEIKIVRKMVITFLLAAGLAYGVFSTMFFARVSGIAGAVSDFLAFLGMWRFDPSTWISNIGFATIILVVYESLILVFGIVGVVSTKEHDIDSYRIMWRLLTVIGFISFLVLFQKPLNPSWLILVAIYYSAIGIGSVLRVPERNKTAFYVKIVLDIVLIAFTWLNYLWLLGHQITPSLGKDPHFIAILFSLGILLLLLVLYVLGWNWDTSSRGLSWAVFVMLVIMTLSMARRTAGFGVDPLVEPYRVDVNIMDQRFLRGTLNTLISQNGLNIADMEVSVIGDPGDSVKWLLKDLEKVQYYDALPPGLSSPLVLSIGTPDPELAATYRGQKFGWYAQPDWQQFKIIDWLNWISLQKGPVVFSEIYLWARTDLFPPIP